jgi:hypothetical protein
MTEIKVVGLGESFAERSASHAALNITLNREGGAANYDDLPVFGALLDPQRKSVRRDGWTNCHRG